MALKVQPFSRGIGCDQDAQWIAGWGGIERAFDFFPAIGRGRTAEDCYALLGAVGMCNRLAQQPLDPASCIFIRQGSNR
jgi:hypothetical protein